jgi:hypothetical protein
LLNVQLASEFTHSITVPVVDLEGVENLEVAWRMLGEHGQAVEKLEKWVDGLMSRHLTGCFFTYLLEVQIPESIFREAFTNPLLEPATNQRIVN